jgi:DNA-binding NarL/FixJ family response regulator
MRLLIADDHPLVRRGLVELLRGAHPEWTFCEASCFDEVIRCCQEDAIDLASIDLLMPGLDGPGALAGFRADFPEVRLVILTGADDRAAMMECVTAGVHGYVLKSSAADHLVRAVEMVIDGGIYLPSILAGAFQVAAGPAANSAAMPDWGAPRSLTEIHGLTARQRDVLDLLAQGCSTKDIARRLNLGVGTVKVHLAGVYKTLGARNRMEAVVKAGKVLQG